MLVSATTTTGKAENRSSVVKDVLKEESFDMQGDLPEELQELAVLITLNSNNHITNWEKIEATASSKLKSFMSETQTREPRYRENPTIFLVPNHARGYFDCFRFYLETWDQERLQTDPPKPVTPRPLEEITKPIVEGQHRLQIAAPHRILSANTIPYLASQPTSPAPPPVSAPIIQTPMMVPKTDTNMVREPFPISLPMTVQEIEADPLTILEADQIDEKFHFALPAQNIPHQPLQQQQQAQEITIPQVKKQQGSKTPKSSSSTTQSKKTHPLRNTRNSAGSSRQKKKRYSSSNGDVGEEDHEGEKIIPFLRILVDMIMENEGVLAFEPGDRDINRPGQIQVIDRSQVEAQVLPRYFNHSSFASLRRQLNYFSFTRVGKGRQHGATYVNENVFELNDILYLKRRPVGISAPTAIVEDNYLDDDCMEYPPKKQRRRK